MPYIGLTFILLVCIEVVLVTFGRVNQKAYPFLLYGTAVGMVLMTTLAGSWLVGSDIHLEYYYAQLRHGGDVLDPVMGTPQGTSILFYLTGNIWIFKVVYPLIFSLIPVILYFLYRRWLEPKQAFLASFLFIAFPTFFIEIPTIAKQMIAEVFLVLSFYLIIKSTLHYKYRIPLLILVSSIMPLIHYSIGIIAFIILGIGLVVSLILRQKVWKLVLVSFISILIVSSIYFPLAEKGAVSKTLIWLYNGFAPSNLQVEISTENFLLESPVTPKSPVREQVKTPGLPLKDRYESLVWASVGLDFLGTSTAGKLFRISQWIVALLLLIGLWKLRRNREYWILASGAILISALCSVPGWAGILNTTRFIHLSLLILAPAFVVALKPKYLLIMLIPYFLFTSGFVFEITKQPNIENITIPYNVGLSNYRMDLGATYTEDDFEVRRYIVENNLFPITTDMWGGYFLNEVVGDRIDMIYSPTRLPGGVEGYVFVRSRNIQEGTFTIWNGIGCRKFVKPEELGIDWNSNIIYQSGDARLIECK